MQLITATPASSANLLADLNRYREWHRLDAARARHLAGMLRMAQGRPFPESDRRLAEYGAACKRARCWARRLQAIERQLRGATA